MIHYDDLPRHYIGTRQAYEVHKNNNDLDPNGWYFIIDTNEVIFEDKNYNHLMIYYTGELPEVKTPDRIYFNLSTLDAHVWNGTQWIQVFGPADVAYISPYNVSTKPASGETTKDYADRILHDTLDELITLKTFVFDPDTRCLNVHIGNDNKLLELSYVASSLVVDQDNYAIQLKDSFGNIISSTIVYPCHVVKGEFNIETLTLDFYYSDDKPVVSIPIEDLFNLLQSNDTTSMFTSVSPSDRSYLRMEVKLSKLEDNQLQLKEDGLYLNWDQYIDKVDSGKQGSILTLDEKGSANPTSGITNQVINTTDKAVTEDGVQQALESAYDSISKSEDIWNAQVGINLLCNSLRVRQINT